MRKPMKSLYDTARGMRLCYDRNGFNYGNCKECPYFKFPDCEGELQSDAVFYLQCYRRLVEFANNPKVVAFLSTYWQWRTNNDNAPSDEELDRMYDEYMEDKKNAENHVL